MEAPRSIENQRLQENELRHNFNAINYPSAPVQGSDVPLESLQLNSLHQVRIHHLPVPFALESLPLHRHGSHGEHVGRVLGPPKKDTDDESSGSSGGSSYQGCLNMTTDELEAAWTWPGEMPVCTGGISDSSYECEEVPQFLMTDCSTYSNLWLWDLALTCNNSSTLEGCSCEFASRLFNAGKIGCTSNFLSSRSSCPDECSVCHTCLTLLGCEDRSGQVGVQNVSTYLVYFLASALGIVIGVAALVVTNKKRKQRRWAAAKDDVNSNFVQLGSSEDPLSILRSRSEGSVWMAPIT